MQQLERHNEYIVTFDGQTPDEAGSRYFIAHDYTTAKAEGINIAQELNLNPSKIRIFYRITITVNTNTVEVGQDTNYEEVLEQIYNEFKPL
ncbi:MAG: hypothetical protein E6448_05105 [Actinomyces sp.]|jgi:hypothetical protein|nr:hypothetical protein [Actinomycetaceae bacterium]MDU5061594.1 hypothetical protein [Actinomyces sp.]MDU5115769.1 hypothetical protein [Actinomyces sp.]MDU6745229.1 hypothetical protein [Actinomyces sp.]